MVAALPATHDKDPAEGTPAADHYDTPPDAPAVPTATYVPWGNTSADDVDSEVDGWSDHAGPVDMSQVDAPTASKPTSFLEAACKGGIPEEVPISQSKAGAVTPASATRQGRSAGRGSAVLREGGRAASGVHAAQNMFRAARRPQTVAEHGWHTVLSRKGSRSAKHVNGGGEGTHIAAQHADVLTKSQKKRHAKKRRKAQQQQDS